MADERCPTCHSRIGTNSHTESGRAQGAEGLDDFEQPIPRWSDDPLYTVGGLNGLTYGGQRNKVRNDHILEIQEARVQQEEDAGLGTPDFSPIPPGSKPTRRHIIELRESTERLLDAAGVSMADYFSLDEDGVPQPQNPALGAFPQTEWTDVERGAPYINKDGQTVTTFELPTSGATPSPTLPSMTKIRAIHIEDLRHPIQVGLVSILVSSTGSIFRGSKKGAATFKDVEGC